MSGEPKGKSIIVTGTGAGIGPAAAIACAAKGEACVIAADVDKLAGQEAL